MAPSERIMTGVRYLKARSKPSFTIVAHLLDGSRGKDDHFVIAVTAAFYCLEIVGLGGLDGSEPGPPRTTLTIRAGNSAPAM